MSSYFIRQKGSAFVVIALLLLFAAACVTDPGAGADIDAESGHDG